MDAPVDLGDEGGEGEPREGSDTVLMPHEICSGLPGSIISFHLQLSPLSCTPQQLGKFSELVTWDLTPLAVICGISLISFKNSNKIINKIVIKPTPASSKDK